MFKDRGLVLRIVPYSDSSVIVRCFTDTQGVMPLFARVSKSRRQSGHLQTGSFIEFSAHERTGSMAAITEGRWDSRIPSNALSPASLGVWLFTVELLQKTLAEKLHLFQLKQRIDRYYAHLLHSAISVEPCVPLLIISSSLGLSDLSRLPLSTHEPAYKDLNTLGYSLPPGPIQNPIAADDVFAFELERLTKHFEIGVIDSLALL